MTPTKCAECGLDVDRELEHRAGVAMFVGEAGEFCARCMRRGKSENTIPARAAKR